MKPSMHSEELLFLDVCVSYLPLWPGYYNSRVSDDGQGIGADGLYFVLTIQPTSEDLLFSM